MKKRIITGGVILILLVVFLLIYKTYTEKREKETIVKNINNSYSQYVQTTKKTDLYDNNHKKIGRINKGIKLKLKYKMITDYKDGYFELLDYPNNYIYYEDYKKVDDYYEYDNYYKNYLVFNENVKLNGNVSIYDNKFKKLYTVNISGSFPIYIKEDKFYGIEYNDHLIYIEKNNNIEIVKNVNTKERNAKDIPVLLYHFFHNHNNFEHMTTVISTRIDKFEEQMKYLSDNNYMTLKMKDLEYYIKGKVQIKEDSVVITIDDGNASVYKLAQPILEKYKVNATVFAITSWDSNVLSKESEHLNIHSHTNNMHQTGKCSGGQGGLFKCISYEQGMEDLKKSRDILNGSTYLAYPFGEYTNESIKMLKDSGFTMALTTNYGKAKVGDDPYLVPRIYFYNEYSLNTFRRVLE